MRLFALTLTSLAFVFGLASASFAEISKARNYYKFSDRVLTTGQPSQSLLENAAKDGIEVVINLVPPSESIYNPQQAEILKSQGIEYIHNPVNWGSPKVSELKSFLQAMDKIGDKKVLVHCWSNARASAFVYAHRVSQVPQNKAAELENLKKVWEDVAGYSLETNQTWLNFLEENTAKAR